MKTRNLFFVCLMFFASFYLGCKKPDNGVHVDPITLYEKVKGNWKLDDIVQIDETAKKSSIKPDETSLYSEFDFSSFHIKLNIDEKNNPTSYEVTGNAPELFPNAGYWDLNVSFSQANASAPALYLYSDAGKTTLIGKLSITALPGANPQMDLVLTRTVDGIAFVSYQYKLSSDQ